MGWSQWRSLRSDGTIADTPAQGFQFKYAIDVRIPWFHLSPPTGTARWEVEIAGSDNTLIFKQKIEFRYMFVSLIIGPMVFMFTWWPDLQNAKVTTEIPESPATLGGEQPYGDFWAGMGGVVAGEAHMMWDYYSGIYLVPLPAGAKFRVRRANVGLPDLRNSSSAIQTRVMAGGALNAARLMQDGMWRILRPRHGGGWDFTAGCDIRGLGGAGEAAWPWSASPAPQEPQVISTVSTATGDARLFYLHETTPTVIYIQGTTLRAVRSTDDGVTWGESMVVAQGITMVAADVGPDGATIYVVGKRGSAPVALLLGFERDEFGQAILRAVDEFEAVGLPTGLPAGQVLKAQDGVFHLLVDSGGRIDYYRSTDGMRSWE